MLYFRRHPRVREPKRDPHLHNHLLCCHPRDDKKTPGRFFQVDASVLLRAIEGVKKSGNEGS